MCNYCTLDVYFLKSVFSFSETDVFSKGRVQRFLSNQLMFKVTQCSSFITFFYEVRSLAFGAAFKLGRLEQFALRRLIKNSRNSAFTGGFWSRFL